MMQHEQMPPAPPSPPRMPLHDPMAFEAQQMRANMERMNIGQGQEPHIHRVSPPPSIRHYSFSTRDTAGTQPGSPPVIYEGYTISRKPPTKVNQKASWALCKRERMPFSQEILKKQLPKKDETSKTFKDIRSFRKQQVTCLIKDRKKQESDNRFDWTLEGLAIDVSKAGSVSLRVFLRRKIRAGEDLTPPFGVYNAPLLDSEIIDLTETTEEDEESNSQYSYPPSTEDPYGQPQPYPSPPLPVYEQISQQFMPENAGHPHYQEQHPQMHEIHHQSQHPHHQAQHLQQEHQQHQADPHITQVHPDEGFFPHHQSGHEEPVEEWRPSSDEKQSKSTKKDKDGKKDKDSKVKVHQRRSRDRKSDRRDKNMGYDSESSQSTSSSRSSSDDGHHKKHHRRHKHHRRDSRAFRDDPHRDVVRVHRRKVSDQSSSNRSSRDFSTGSDDFVQVEYMPERNTRRITDKPHYYRRRDSSYFRDQREARRHPENIDAQRSPQYIPSVTQRERIRPSYAVEEIRRDYRPGRRTSYMNDIHEIDHVEELRLQNQELQRNLAYREQEARDRERQDRMDQLKRHRREMQDRDLAGIRDLPREYAVGGGWRDRDLDRSYGGAYYR